MQENTQEKTLTYTQEQETLAFQKELNILRNDFYYQVVEEENASLVDFLYKPLDILSGDAYTARRIDEHRTLYMIVDGMGKGLSASLTAMTMTSFVNHIIDKMVEFDSFSLNILIKESIDFIKPILFEEEALALDIVLFNSHFHTLEYAKFAMPPFLLQDSEQNIIKIKSNNLPISKWMPEHKTDIYHVENIDKFLFYSDGLVENMTHDDLPYQNFIEEDFRDSFTRGDFRDKMMQRTREFSDDVTLIYINKLGLNHTNLLAKNTFASKLSEVDSAIEWFETLCTQENVDTKLQQKMSVVFNELFMNAYEHGNLGINTKTKHKLIEEDTYIDMLLQFEENCDKKIKVEVHKLHYNQHTYLVTKILDEGDGFDTQILSEIFRNSQRFNGRGVIVSRKNSLGIYYNHAGNCVLFLNKIN